MSEEIEQSNETPDYESQAREQGWVPQEEYTGDPSKWKDAKKFVEDGEHIAALATKRKRDLERELDEMRVTLSQQQQVFARQAQKDRQERDALISQLEEARAKAITHGNGNEAVQLERQIRSLENENQMAQQFQPTPVAMAWHRNNPWYGADEKLTRAADGIGQSYRALNPTASESEILDHVSEEIRKLSGMQGRRPQSPDSGSPAPKGGKKPTSFDSLPDEVKVTARRIIKSGAYQVDDNGRVIRDAQNRPVKMTEEYYAKRYFGK